MESLLNWGREKISTPDQSIDKIKSVLLSISKELVDYPNEVAITVTEEDQITKLCLTANKSDLGKIIGKEGRMASSLRTIVYALASKAKVKTILDIS